MSKKRPTSYLRASIGALQPLDTSPFREPSSPWRVGGSIFLVWLVSLLPWRIWVQAPELLMLIVCFCALYEPGRGSMFLGFFLVVLIDVNDVSVIVGHFFGFVYAF